MEMPSAEAMNGARLLGDVEEANLEEVRDRDSVSYFSCYRAGGAGAVRLQLIPIDARESLVYACIV